jgi:hypothetical protein
MTSPCTTARSGTRAVRSERADEDHAVPGAHAAAADQRRDRRTTSHRHPPPRFTLPATSGHALTAPPVRAVGGSR